MFRALFTIIIAGTSAVGKTMSLAAVVQAVLTAADRDGWRGALQAFVLSAGIRSQLTRVLSGLEPLTSTQQVAPPPAAGEGELPAPVRDVVAKLPPNAEWAYFSFPDRDELFYTTVGQAVPDPDALRAELRDDPNRVLVACLHRGLSDTPENNRTAFLTLVAQLQAVGPGVTLADALAKSATLLYHSHALLPAPPPPPNQPAPHFTPADLAKLVPEVGPLEALPRLRLEAEGDAFHVTGGLDVQNTQAVTTLQAVADAFYHAPEQESYRKLFHYVAQDTPERVVGVVSHAEMFPTVPLAARHHDPCDLMFGDAERAVSQQVVGGFQKRKVTADGKTLNLDRFQLQVDTGRRVYRAVRRRCDRPRQPAAVTEGDHVGPAHLLREVAARAAAAVPVALAVVLAVELFGAAVGVLDRKQWLSPWHLSLALPLAAAAVVAALTWVRHQLGRPAWAVVPGAGGPRVSARRLDGVAADAPLPQVRLRQTGLGRLLGFATGTLNGNRVRTFGFPAVDRLTAVLGLPAGGVAVAWWKDAAAGVMVLGLIVLHVVAWLGGAADGGVLVRLLVLAAAAFVVFSPFRWKRRPAA